jgi:hypothetical protein
MSSDRLRNYGAGHFGAVEELTREAGIDPGCA